MPIHPQLEVKWSEVSVLTLAHGIQRNNRSLCRVLFLQWILWSGGGWLWGGSPGSVWNGRLEWVSHPMCSRSCCCCHGDNILAYKKCLLLSLQFTNRSQNLLNNPRFVWEKVPWGSSSLVAPTTELVLSTPRSCSPLPSEGGVLSVTLNVPVPIPARSTDRQSLWTKPGQPQIKLHNNEMHYKVLSLMRIGPQNMARTTTFPYYLCWH